MPTEKPKTVNLMPDDPARFIVDSAMILLENGTAVGKAQARLMLWELADAFTAATKGQPFKGKYLNTKPTE